MFAPRRQQRSAKPAPFVSDDLSRVLSKPKRGMMGERLASPKPNWADRLAVVGGHLMDLDGTMGSGNAGDAQDRLDQLNGARRDEAENARRQAAISEAIRGMDPSMARLAEINLDGVIKGMTERAFAEPKERRIVQGADGRKYYADDQSPVLPGVEGKDDREIIKGADGYSYYADSKERVLPGVQQQPEQMSPYQQAQITMRQEAAAEDRRRWEAEQAAQAPVQSDLPLAFGGQGGAGFDGGSGFGRATRPDMANAEGGFFRVAFGDNLKEHGPDLDEFKDEHRFGYDDARSDDPAWQTGNMASAGYYKERPGTAVRPLYSPGNYQKYKNSDLGKQDAARMGELRASANIEQDLSDKLSEMEALLEAGAPIGPNPGIRTTAADILPFSVPTLVPNDDQAARMRAFNSIATTISLENFAAKTKGAISNAEMEMFLKAGPNWHTRPESARMVIDILRKGAMRSQERAAGAEEWERRYGGLSVPNELGRTFDAEWSAYVNSNPITDRGEVPGGNRQPGDEVDVNDGTWE
ncbi:MAG: hypothetical protein AAGK02_08065 [Pseudomonadota bacterium]